jgi:hypothetical protein
MKDEAGQGDRIQRSFSFKELRMMGADEKINRERIRS